MNILSWLSSFSGIAQKAPVKILPKVFVRAVERTPQKYGIIFFRLRFINNSSFTVEITDCDTDFDATFYFCGSLLYPVSQDDLIVLDGIGNIPLLIPAGKSEDITICAEGIPIDAAFGVRAKSPHDAQPDYVLTIM